jgi:hypothetical protein
LAEDVLIIGHFDRHGLLPVTFLLLTAASILDHQIDQLIYNLYGLTKEGIRIVEASERLRSMPTKQVRFSAHARLEMRRRGIRTSEVVRTIHHPGQVLPSLKGREIYQRRIGRGGRLLLRVVVKQAASVYHVITAYKTSNIAKYWRTP